MGLDIYFRAYIKGKKQIIAEFRNTDTLFHVIDGDSGVLEKDELKSIIERLETNQRTDDLTKNQIPNLKLILNRFDVDFDEIIYSCSY